MGDKDVELNSEDTYAANYSYLLVPTWIFIGDVIIDENNMGDSTLCYVNALDGSIIDPKLGY